MRYIDTNGNSYSINANTVIAHHVIGGSDDLNADGEPCMCDAGLANFVNEMHDMDAFDADTRDALLLDI